MQPGDIGPQMGGHPRIEVAARRLAGDAKVAFERRESARRFGHSLAHGVKDFVGADGPGSRQGEREGRAFDRFTADDGAGCCGEARAPGGR